MLALESYGLKFKFGRIKICVVVRYSPNVDDDGERDRFCNYLNTIVYRVGNGYRLWVLGDLNGWTGDRVRDFTM